MSLQDEYNKRRAVYLDASRGRQSEAHQTFYRWLAHELRIGPSGLPATREEIQASADPHFNDIPLIRWDHCHPWVSQRAGSAGLRYWSLSDTVCVLKAVANDVRTSTEETC